MPVYWHVRNRQMYWSTSQTHVTIGASKQATCVRCVRTYCQETTCVISFLNNFNNFPSTTSVLWRLICTKTVFGRGFSALPRTSLGANDAPPISLVSWGWWVWGRPPPYSHPLSAFCLSIWALSELRFLPSPPIQVPGYATTRYAPSVKKFWLYATARNHIYSDPIWHRFIY